MSDNPNTINGNDIVQMTVQITYATVSPRSPHAKTIVDCWLDCYHNKKSVGGCGIPVPANDIPHSTSKEITYNTDRHYTNYVEVSPDKAELKLHYGNFQYENSQFTGQTKGTIRFTRQNKRSNIYVFQKPYSELTEIEKFEFHDFLEAEEQTRED